jgi:phosphatidylglycerophosphate synthase
MRGSAETDQDQTPGKAPFLTLPNLLTLSRIPLGALVWLRPLDPVFVLGIMTLAGITDVLDGWVERRRHPGSTAETAGAWLDPLCDKIFILSVLLAITVAGSLPLWLVPLIALREILQTLVAVGSRTLPACAGAFASSSARTSWARPRPSPSSSRSEPSSCTSPEPCRWRPRRWAWSPWGSTSAGPW